MILALLLAAVVSDRRDVRGVIRIEASAVDTWFAMETLYRNGDPEKIVRSGGLFAHIANHPDVYLEGTDAEPGHSEAFGENSTRALKALFIALQTYGSPRHQRTLLRWRKVLYHNDPVECETAIAEIASWVSENAPRVAAMRGAAHAAALRRVPNKLREWKDLPHAADSEHPLWRPRQSYAWMVGVAAAFLAAVALARAGLLHSRRLHAVTRSRP